MKSKEKAVIKRECHSREFLSGISTLVSQSGGDPRLQASGMTNTATCHAELVSASSRYHNYKTLNQVQGDDKRGFTLIELLVVVLIIGILAAVALPQYQFAVVKSRVASFLPLMKAISDAESVYYLANGTSSKDVGKLDINVPESCRPITISNRQILSCGSDIVFDNSALEVVLSYCPNHNSTRSDCVDHRDFRIHFYNSGYKNNAKECIVQNNSSLGTKICNSLNLN